MTPDALAFWWNWKRRGDLEGRCFAVSSAWPGTERSLGWAVLLCVGLLVGGEAGEIVCLFSLEILQRNKLSYSQCFSANCCLTGQCYNAGKYLIIWFGVCWGIYRIGGVPCFAKLGSQVFAQSSWEKQKRVLSKPPFSWNHPQLVQMTTMTMLLKAEGFVYSVALIKTHMKSVQPFLKER